jgi:hypothetical protein
MTEQLALNEKVEGLSPSSPAKETPRSIPAERHIPGG